MLTIKIRPLKLFVHIVRSDPDEDHARALNAGIDKRGYAPSSGTLDKKTSGRERPATLHKTAFVSVKWWRLLRSSRGLSHDDDDDDEYSWNYRERELYSKQ